jgi:hypothetical protein
MGAYFEEIPGKASASGGKSYVIHEDPTPERLQEYFVLAYEFDGYAAYPEDLGERANEVCKVWNEAKDLPDDLTLLRSCLFYESRRARFVWGYPSESEMGYLDALVKKIKTIMALG